MLLKNGMETQPAKVLLTKQSESKRWSYNIVLAYLFLAILYLVVLGAVHKVRHAPGESKKVLQFVAKSREFLNTFLSYTWNLKLKWCLTVCFDGCILTEDVTSIIVKLQCYMKF